MVTKWAGVREPGQTEAGARQQEYRRRKAAGEVIAKPLPQFCEPPPVVPLTDGERGELIDRHSEQVQTTLVAWLIRQPTQNTRVTYRAAWQAWCKWCVDHGENWFEPRAGLGAAWLADMERAGLSGSTRRLRMVAVRGAIFELMLEGLSVGGDPFARCRQPKVDDVSATVPLTDDEVHGALATATVLGGRYRTLLLLLGVVGLRASEAAQVVECTVRESPWGPVASVLSKGGGHKLVPLPPLVVEAAAVDGWPLEGYVGGRPRDRVAYMVRRVGERAGVRLHPHQFRHWHATVALREGVPLERVQDSMGHSDPATTQRYNRARVVIEGHSAFTVQRFVEGEQT